MALLLLALVSSPANTCMIPSDTRPTLEDCETACGAISCGCSTPWHVVEQETTRTGAKSWFCSSPAASAYALVTPEGSSYRTLTIVESGGGVADHDGAFRFPDGTYAPACWGYVAAGGASGAYWIDPTGSSPFKVYCEMDTDGGGWTLVDNDASTTSRFSRRELGANTNLTATRGSILPAYTWSSAPRLLCKSSGRCT